MEPSIGSCGSLPNESLFSRNCTGGILQHLTDRKSVHLVIAGHRSTCPDCIFRINEKARRRSTSPNLSGSTETRPASRPTGGRNRNGIRYSGVFVYESIGSFSSHGTDLLHRNDKLGISIITLKKGIELLLCEEINIQDRFDCYGNNRHDPVL